MAMSKGDYIALADAIREHNAVDTKVHGGHICRFTEDEIKALADFCQSRSPKFMRERWLGYIAGTNGKNGGEIHRKSS